jgi:SNF2 family DNA or RNA helicase
MGGFVEILEGDAEHVVAEVQGSQAYEVTLNREEDKVFAYCECAYYVSSGICKHVWAVVLEAEKRGYLRGTTGYRAKGLFQNWESDKNLNDDEDDDFPFELSSPRYQSSRNLAPKPPPRPKWEALLQQIPPTTVRSVETWRADRELYYVLNLKSTGWSSSIDAELQLRERKKDGNWGKLKTARISRDEIATIPSEADREILQMLSGTPLSIDWENRESIPYGYRLRGAMAPMLLEKICATGRCLSREDYKDAPETLPRITFDGGPAWQFRLYLDRSGDSWLLTGDFTRGDDRLAVGEVLPLLPTGLMFARGSLVRFEGTGAYAWSRLLMHNGTIEIPACDADSFLARMVTRSDLPPLEWPEEFKLTRLAPELQPCLRLEPQQNRGKSNGMFCAHASFIYDGLDVPASEGGTGFFNRDQRVLLRRDLAAEQQRLSQLESLGFKQESQYYEPDRHHHLPAKKLATSVRELIRQGWHVEIEGRAFRKPSQYKTDLTSGVDWFELRTTVDYGGAVAQLPDLLKAIKQKSGLVELSDGSLGMLPDELLQNLTALLVSGKAAGDHLRFSRSQTALLDALLASRPEISVDETFLRAREHLRSFERIEPACQPGGFNGTLRNYQCDGLAWMRFLQDLGFGGCLADDMGLGKTAQVLALLEQRRELRESGEDINPSLAVVPRSLIFNWIQEAQRFTPKLRILDHSGVDRKKQASSFAGYDLVLATYGTIRRDVAMLQGIRFDYAILDEAQAIKNADSDSAKAVRLIEAKHRLALSGTPIQNHLGELYSLFEFLNPGMLGSMRALSAVGVSLREPDEATRQMLALAVRPFLLRRTKDQVARELPERTEQTIYCELDARERKQYNELREHYRSSLMGRVEQQGIAKSQMHILEALLRLRQAACHPGLLDSKRKNDSSAKIDTLLANLSEVLSEGHKVLVFSQFTSLLSIVRASLDREKTEYEYLDGRTRDRESRVQRFQTDPDCKLFLISLKAGGVGLNLTAADYVFLLDPWWNPAVEAQAIDRTHRIGQTSHVFAYRLIARDTVEEKVLELQTRKRSLAESIIRADASLVSNLKREDLEFLLS